MGAPSHSLLQSGAFHQPNEAQILAQRIERRIVFHIRKKCRTILAGAFQTKQRLVFVAERGVNQRGIVWRYIALRLQILEHLKALSRLIWLSPKGIRHGKS